ncbi:hypothetical protein N7504_007427 [Penicillium tannophilum]|nr:hypothetical protein N7504_007427 [Penicillium tannophilum]
MAQFLRDPAVLNADIIAIQEPWINPYNDTTHHPAKQTHELLWPEGEGERSRVCLFVSKKLAGWTHFAHSGDVQELRLKTERGEVSIFNIYNEQGKWDGLNLLKSVVAERPRDIYLMLGDFNLHHPLAWDCWLEPGTVTRMDARSSTTIDLVLASRRLTERMISCEVSMETHADSDHLPIRTVLGMETQEVEEPERRRSWKSMDVEKFTDFVSANLLGKRWMELPELSTPQRIDNVVEHLVDVVQQGVQQSTPWARPSTWAKPGWTPECTHIIKETRQAFRRWKKVRKRPHLDVEELHEEYRSCRNRKGKVIKKALQNGFRSWIQETVKSGPRGLWRVSKWARNRDQGGGSVIPALQKADGSLADTDKQTSTTYSTTILLFNAPLIQGCSLYKGDGAISQGYGWVDDAAVIVESESYARNVEILDEVLQRADLWAKRHAAKFAPDKFELIHFTNPRKKDKGEILVTSQPTQPADIYDFVIPDPGTDQLPVHINNNQAIQPSPHSKYLGIWLDKELSFVTHQQKLIGKANASLKALSTLTGSSHPADALRRDSVVPKFDKAKSNHQFIYQITTARSDHDRGSFQEHVRSGVKRGAFLLPVQLQIEQTIQETAIRIQTGATWAQPFCLHPRLGKRTLTQTRLGGLSPLEKLRWKKGGILFGESQSEPAWESKSAFVLPPWEKRVNCIIQNSDAAIKTHDQIQSEGKVVFFTDGSGFEGKVGASAVAPDRGIQARRFLGTTEQATVYAAELAGIEMALDKFKSINSSYGTRELVIFADSRAAIQAVQNPKRPSGQHILRAIYAHIRELRARQTPTALSNPSDETSISIRWIPAHVGVPGNELADAAAKNAALGGAENAEGIVGSEDQFPRLAATAKQQVRRRIQERWALSWAKEKTGKPNQKLVPAPHKKTLRLFEGLPKHYTSILVQMRSMRIALNHFLFKIGEVESDFCSCEEGSQTPRHVLLHCPRFMDERKEMMEKIRARTDLRGNLMDYEALLSHPRATRYVAEFMLQTGLLGQFRQCDVEPEPEDDETTGQN